MLENMFSLDAVYISLIFIVPGYITYWIRSNFVTGRQLAGHEYYVHLLTLSAVNFVLFGWVAYLALAWDAAPIKRVFTWVFVLAVAPALIGFVSAFATNAGWLRKIYGRLGLSPVHVIPTAWDYSFSKLGETWVYVVLKNDTTFAGYWGEASFASSVSGERDILIEKVYTVSGDGSWNPTNRSVLIASGEICTIEFIPVERGSE